MNLSQILNLKAKFDLSDDTVGMLFGDEDELAELDEQLSAHANMSRNHSHISACVTSQNWLVT